MGLIKRVREWVSTLLERTIKETFDVKLMTATEQDDFLRLCRDIYKGFPFWESDDDHIGTVNFAKAICSEVARLTTMNISIVIEGGARAAWLQAQADDVLGRVRRWVEYGAGFGTVILKPNGSGIDLITPEQFRVVSWHDGKITGVVFIDYTYDADADVWYTRLEHQRLTDAGYAISQRVFSGRKAGDTERQVAIENSPWSDLSEEVVISGVTDMLFGVLRMPAANNIDLTSPVSLPIFSDAIEELKSFDVAYSRFSSEIYDSRRTVLLDSDRLLAVPGRVGQANKDALLKSMRLPDYVRAIEGTSAADSDVYHEINPSLFTDERLKGLNAILSQLGFKCGFSNGYFVFNQKTGMVTATQVESDDRRTIQLINDVRHALIQALDGLFYALDRFADIYGLAPRSEYEVTYDFADLTLNEDEDKARWWSYVQANRVPFWYFLVKFEGLSEEEAKALSSEAAEPEPVFAEEE